MQVRSDGFFDFRKAGSITCRSGSFLFPRRGTRFPPCGVHPAAPDRENPHSLRGTVFRTRRSLLSGKSLRRLGRTQAAFTSAGSPGRETICSISAEGVRSSVFAPDGPPSENAPLFRRIPDFVPVRRDPFPRKKPEASGAENADAVFPPGQSARERYLPCREKRQSDRKQNSSFSGGEE